MKYSQSLPSREECQEIVKNSEVFYCNKKIIDGAHIELYDYRLASLPDFDKHNAFELRGLCFIEDSNLNEWKRYPVMNKFFNINESKSDNYSWMYDDIKDKKITRIQNKDDGSVITFIKINNKVYAKSKMSFDSEQAKMAQEIYENNLSIKEAVDDSLEANMTLVFELVSPFNQIVLDYQNTELILLQIRHNSNGEYCDSIFIKEVCETYNIKCTTDFNINDFSFEKLLELQKTETNIEGWVVTLEDGQMLKIKTDWYFQMHRLTTENANNENILVQTILEDKIDDVISQLVVGQKRDYVIEITKLVTQNFNHLVIEYIELYKKYIEVNNRKEFASLYSTYPLFTGLMRKINILNEDNLNEMAKEEVTKHLLHNTRTLTMAREYIKGLRDDIIYTKN